MQREAVRELRVGHWACGAGAPPPPSGRAAWHTQFDKLRLGSMAARVQHIAEHMRCARPQRPHQCSPAPSSARGGAGRQPVSITAVRTRDVRFGLPPGDGTDSVHSLGGRIYYGFGVTVIETSAGGGLVGNGLGFTLGAGTDMVCQAIEHLAKPLVGCEIEELMASFGRTFNAMAEHPALRWLGPHNGVTHLAIASICNACFDLWAKARGMPLWQLLLELTDEQLVDLLDLSYVDDVLDREAALALLASERPGRAARAEKVLAQGLPGYGALEGKARGGGALMSSESTLSLANASVVCGEFDC